MADVRTARPTDLVDDLEGALQLAKQLCERLATPCEDEQAHGVRLRLLRAHAHSVVDLLHDVVNARLRGG